MSENVAETCHDIDGVTKPEVKSHQSVWMSHWMNNASCKSTTKQACGRLSIGFESQEEENRDSMEKAGNGSEECEKRSSLVAETPKSLRLADEKLKSSFPMFNLQRKVDDSGDGGGGGGEALFWKIDRPSSSQWENLKPQAHHNDEKGFQLFSLGGSDKQLKDLPPMLQWVHDAKSPPKENPFKREGVVELQDQGAAENTKGDFVVSGSKVNPYGFSFGKTLARSLCQKEEINQSDSIVESGQHRVTSTVYRTNSMFLVHDKAATNPFEKSKNPLMTFNDSELLPRGSSTSGNHQPGFVAKQLFLSKNNPVDLSGSKKYDGHFPLPSPPCHARDTDAVRLCTTQDSFEESLQLRKKFSATTTHHFLLAKTDFSLREGGQMLRESMVSANFDRDSVFPVKSGVKLKLLGSSGGSEGEKDAQEFKASSVNIRNEASSETNTMDTDTFKKNRVSGVVSSSSNKHVEPEKQTTILEAVVERETIGSSQKRKLPDINQKPNDPLAYVSSEDTSTTSRTQSLDAEHLLLNSELPPLKPNPRLMLGLKSEPSRWVKRLRTSSKTGEVENSHKKVNTIFSKIMKFTTMTGREEPPPPARLGQRAALPSATSASAESLRHDRNATLSHSWVQRLRRQTAAAASSSGEGPKAAAAAAAEVSESQHSKASTEMSDKQFPSLAAMALMGKALRGYSSCPLKKSGSALVWDS